MWQRFTERSRRVVFFAQEEAGRLGENYVSSEHLLLGLARADNSVAARVLERMGVSIDRVRNETEKQVTRGDGKLGQDMQLTPRAKRIIDLAYDESRILGQNYIGTEHLLLGMIREGEGLAGRVLAKCGVELERTRREIKALLEDEGSSESGRKSGPLPVSEATAPDNAAPRQPASSAPAPTQDALLQRQFAREFNQLPAEQRTQMLGDGIPLNQLPLAMQLTIKELLPARTQGTYVLDPTGPVRAAVVKMEGATHFTVTARASFVVNFVTSTPFAETPAAETTQTAGDAPPTPPSESAPPAEAQDDASQPEGGQP